MVVGQRNILSLLPSLRHCPYLFISNVYFVIDRNVLIFCVFRVILLFASQ